MAEKLSFWQHLTDRPKEAQYIWEDIFDAIKETGRQDILSNPAVLDVGGGMGEFSKYLNGQGIRCVSLDMQDLEVEQSANPVKGDIHRMPFADASFDIVHGRGVFDNMMYQHDFPLLLQEIARVLKSRGILSVYDFTPPTEEVEKFFKRLSKAGKEYPTLWEKK